MGPTSLLIMLFKSYTNDAATQGIFFLKILTTAKCIIALANTSLFAGFYIITPGWCLHPLFQPQCCTFTNANIGLKQEFLLSYSSNNPCFLHTKFNPIDAAKMIACIVNPDLDNVPWSFHSGPAFMVSNITITTILTNTLSPTATYKIYLY